MRVEPISPMDDKREWAEDIRYRFKKTNEEADFERKLENAKQEINEKCKNATIRIENDRRESIYTLCAGLLGCNNRVTNNWLDYFSRNEEARKV